MRIGSVVRYQYKYPDGMEIDWIGIVTERADSSAGFSATGFYVQWNNGVLDWRLPRELEVICE